jgi:hypothetical protein
MDPITIQTISAVVGPLGVLVVVVAWAIISRRSGNGRSDRYQVVVAKLDALRDDVSEIKGDVRELRAGLVRHLEDHANT